ncbi:RHS repeat domain-containing protein, partial [Polaromonas sp. A23]|uniref:RHS repeat domain-containing protein n=1 Tax=Polaromonas sp. A23 TaxID=1944133 RepID=UPI0009CEBA2F
KHYVSAGGLVFAMFVQRTGTLGSTAPTATNYFHHDHLGSMVAVSDENGAVIERMAFDPWGKRRFVNGTPDVLDSIVGFNTDRGYTMHEHLDEMGVIHMNGRIYDPLIGRFMSADPFIQDPSNLQSFNRYTYVMNNPLALTDPSGYFSFKSFFKALISHIAAPTPKNAFNLIAAQPGQKQVDNYVMTHKWAYTAGQAVVTFFTAPFCGGCGAALWSSYYAYQGTGSMSEAFKAGAITYASYTYGDSMLGAMVIGCVGAAASGGDCGRGAVAGAIGTLGSGYGAMGSIIASCAAGSINGGSCSDGAKNAVVSMGVQYLFGQAMGRKSDPTQRDGSGTALDVLGKVWNSPNTAIGIVYGSIGYVVGRGAYELGFQALPPGIIIGDNAIQFTNNPFGHLGAITLGNVQVFGGSPNDLAADGNRMGLHEMQHTYQGQLLGPLYLPSNILGGLAGLLFGGAWHAPQNWNERGPQQHPSKPW